VREKINRRLRFAVFVRDHFTCQYCGRSAPDTVLEIDHRVPVARGGSGEKTNLVTACVDCNLGKSDVAYLLSMLPTSLDAMEDVLTPRSDVFGELFLLPQESIGPRLVLDERTA
jgi:hypothetical protein